MKRLMILVSIILTICTILTNGQAPCIDYQPGICSSINTYQVSPAFGTQETTDNILMTLGFENITLIGKIDPVCGQAGLNYACSQGYAHCDSLGNITYMCASTCQRFYDKCVDILTTMNATNYLPNCEGLPQTNCYAAPFSDQLPQDFVCPLPLIINPDRENPSDACVGYCCIPCPPMKYFYLEGQLDAAETVIMICTFLSVFTSIFTITTHVLMPEKRAFPHTIILCGSISSILFYFTQFFALGDQQRVRCINEVTASSPGNNLNVLCQTQNFFVVYGVLAAIFWCAGSKEYVEYAIMIPVAMCTIPSVLLNIHVLIKLAKFANRTKSSLPSIFRLQLRFFAFTVVILFIFLFYWIHFELHLSKVSASKDSPWIKEWFLCVVQDGGQNYCSKIASQNLPEIGALTFSEILISLIGVVLFGFFSATREVIDFWKILLSGNRNRIFEVQSSFEMNSNRNSRSQSKSGTRSSQLGSDPAPE